MRPALFGLAVRGRAGIFGSVPGKHGQRPIVVEREPDDVPRAISTSSECVRLGMRKTLRRPMPDDALKIVAEPRSKTARSPEQRVYLVAAFSRPDGLLGYLLLSAASAASELYLGV
jgi:hypothetical protein